MRKRYAVCTDFFSLFFFALKCALLYGAGTRRILSPLQKGVTRENKLEQARPDTTVGGGKKEARRTAEDSARLACPLLSLGNESVRA